RGHRSRRRRRSGPARTPRAECAEKSPCSVLLTYELLLVRLQIGSRDCVRSPLHCSYPSKLVLTLCGLGFTESGYMTRSRYPDVVLDASSVYVLVEAAVRVARRERRRVALEDIEAVGGVRIARIIARYKISGVGPGHVDPAVHGRYIDVVAQEADHSRAVRFPVVVTV